MAEERQKFNPQEYMMKLKGKDYLEVKYRLVWFREEHPEGKIFTELLEHDFEEGYAVFRAQIEVPNKATAVSHGSETRKDFPDYLEKAETKAIGRALAAIGFGTQFADDFDLEGEAGATGRTRLADAPVERKTKKAKADVVPACEDCGNALRDIPPRNGRSGMSAAQYGNWTKKSYGKVLCSSCRPRTASAA